MLDLGPPQQRTVLALLLVRAGRAAPISEFVEALWGDAPPQSARNLLHRCVGTLRRLFEPDLPARAPGRWLTPDGGGYRLTVDSTNLDLARFRELTRQARRTLPADQGSAASLFGEALDLWRGDCGTGVEWLGTSPPPFGTIDRERTAVAIEAAEAALSGANRRSSCRWSRRRPRTGSTRPSRHNRPAAAAARPTGPSDGPATTPFGHRRP
ncbi:AfsR/SARP family transcriptional regulator [Streptosporangium oxazolinicum]|uniref:AfsR/SARP family transcriptional regulator n=1 Tax=Streptosporangium oxazolinicum TaxID=909287 RepID=UPI0031F0436A